MPIVDRLCVACLPAGHMLDFPAWRRHTTRVPPFKTEGGCSNSASGKFRVSRRQFM